jgi:methylmalonyl-CoA epimerase
MKVEKIDHVAIRVRDLGKATKFFSDLLGTEFSEIGESEELDIRSVMDPLGIEIVEPLTPDGVTARAIKQRGEGLVLISLKVSDLEEGLAETKAQGIEVVSRTEHSGRKLAVLHPRDTYGVMIELIEYRPKHPLLTLTE